jgi:hypothetical protein
MDKTEIDKQIKLAVFYKHNDQIEKAIEIEEKCLVQCIREKGTPKDGLAILFKALGKLYYANRNTNEAALFFAAAADLFLWIQDNVDSKYEVEAINCIIFLGTCHPAFVQSHIYESYRLGVQTGVPEGQLSPDLASSLATCGMEMLQEAKKIYNFPFLAEKILGRKL